MKFNADALKALARKIIAKRKSDEAATAREKENTLRRYTKAIGNQLEAVRAVAPAAYMLKSRGIKLVDDFFVGWAYEFPETSDRILFSNDYGRVVCHGRYTDDVMVTVDFETGKYTVTGQHGELTPDEVAEKCRDYCDELFDRLKLLSEGLAGFAEDVAAKISALAK
jgi:hypothetical protein